MYPSDWKRDIRKYHESNGDETYEDEDGNLVVQTDEGRREYDKNGRGGYTLSSGPSSVYVDEFGNT